MLRSSHTIFSSICFLVLFLAKVTCVSATEDEIENSIDTTSGYVATGTVSTGVSASGTIDTDISMDTSESGSVLREKTIREINTFLINSYKRKFDRIFTDIQVKFSQFSPEKQARLYRQISVSVGDKLSFIRTSPNLTDNRREVLSSVFVYIQYRMDKAVDDASGRK